jgi:EAL domain-containing protein (putative c-di-GMP-specific phosphodiesterase class I)/DNA-binding response OmpR family regulator
MRILAYLDDRELRQALDDAAGQLHAEVTTMTPTEARETETIREARPDIILVEMTPTADLSRVRAETDGTGAALLAACHDPAECEAAVLARADDWVLLPTQSAELALRITGARNRALGIEAPRREEELVDLIRYRELLYDKLTGFPTLPIMIQYARELIDTRGELTILYIHFVWYSRVEELYGWQKLDDVLETTANAVREFYNREHPSTENAMLVSHAADDDFILFTHLPTIPEVAERQLKALAVQLETSLRGEIERVHGEDIAALCGVYVGTATLFRNPKIRTERLIYRGIREAATAARGAMEWEQTRKIADLKATIREGAVYMEYHPIIITKNEEIYGYEALARGARRELRSPDVLFEVAAEANLLWELGRLLRTRAIQGISRTIRDDQCLFLNVDPHDFDDPVFRELDPASLGIQDPRNIVLEITERTAIKDYPRFQEYLTEFRNRGYRFAVDDAGSGYAGLGSIANLAPDYIKLDISLISNIDTNFLKQNLVETMVQFAENQGAQVIAEGVERREEFETIRDLGVHLTQGFLFHRPKSAEAIAATEGPRS